MNRVPNALLVVDDIAYADSAGEQEVVIIKTAGAGSVLGEFSGLAEGSVVNTPKDALKISYVGGDGNDISLKYLSRGTVIIIL